jgi:hypothetical protein
MVDGMPELTTEMPNLRRYLLEYPNANLANATSFLYWQETEFGLKPTIRISHLTIRKTPEDTVVASKMVYAKLLDGARGACPRARSEARCRILVRYGESREI